MTLTVPLGSACEEIYTGYPSWVSLIWRGKHKRKNRHLQYHGARSEKKFVQDFTCIRVISLWTFERHHNHIRLLLIHLTLLADFKGIIVGE
jgi:hypothetical protein